MFNWEKREDRPLTWRVVDQPVALNSKLYVRGENRLTQTVLVYTPDHDQWDELPPPPVKHFTIATLRGKLLVVGGRDKSTYRKTDTILTFSKHSKKWVQIYSSMPTALTNPAVRGYRDYLIVACGRYSVKVDILDTVNNKWKTAQPLPCTDPHYYYTALIKDYMYLVGQHSRIVLRAHIPTLISGAKFYVWKILSQTPCYCSVPVSIGNTLLTVGGTATLNQGEIPVTSIQMYNSTTNRWKKVGDFPELLDPFGVITNSTLFTFATYKSRSVYVSILTLLY